MTLGSNNPLLNFSASDKRATLLTEDLNLVSNQEPTNYTAKKKPTKGTKTSGTQGTRGIRISKGKVVFHVPGYPGVQRFAATQIVQFVPISKLKAAAKRILKTSKRRPKNQQQKRKQHRIQ
jgi:hypothetical protein